MVVFTAEPLSQEEIRQLQEKVAPSKVSVVIDNIGLHQEIQALSQPRKEKFLKRCKVTDPTNLTWGSECPGRIAYNWQAEFRSVKIWTHPALANYKYMMWMDSDGFPTRVWDKDPIAFMIENDLIIFFDHFPQGRIHRSVKFEMHHRIYKSFNKTICKLELSKEDGSFITKLGTKNECRGVFIPLIHGFFHITNLDFFRSDIVTNWVNTLIGDCFLCREFDDQAAVTIPTAILEPNRSRGKVLSCTVVYCICCICCIYCIRPCYT